MGHWYCLTCPPGADIQAAEALEADGYSVLLPLEYRFKRRHPKGPAVVYPVSIMAGYLVAELAEYDLPRVRRLEKISGKRLIHGVLGMDDKPYALPSLVVTYVRNMVLQHLVVPLTRGLVVGDIVIIESGPFAGKRAKVTSLRRGNARVVLNMFGALREIDIAKELVSPEIADCGQKAAA